MKKLKSKKKPTRIKPEQPDATAVIAGSDTEVLELAPQRPLANETQTQFQAEPHNN